MAIAFVSAVASNTDAFETTHSVTIDVGSAADRFIVGFAGQVTDSTSDLTSASLITLAGASTGVTLAGTDTTPEGQPDAHCRWFKIAVPSGITGSQTLAVTLGAGSTARRIPIIAAAYTGVSGASFNAYGSNTFDGTPTITVTGATGEEAVLMVISTTAGLTLTPGTGSSNITGGNGGTGITLWSLRENSGASVVVDGTWGSSQEYCCAGFSLTPAPNFAPEEQDWTAPDPKKQTLNVSMW